ncbi:MAG: WG repeat-containing protein [Bacteroidetes bacterium]|nr:WG repeat-containing protein [Bacteroidota bacterium]
MLTTFSPAQALHRAQNAAHCSYGLKNDKEEWVLQPNYASIDYSSSKLGVTGWWIISGDGIKYGLADDEGKIIFQPLFNNVILEFNPAQKNIFDPPPPPYINADSTISVSKVSEISNQANRMNIYYEGEEHVGLADSSGKILCPPRYAYMQFENEKSNYASILVKDLKTGNSLSGYMDKHGNEAVKPEWKIISPEGKKGVWVSNGIKTGFVNWNGKFHSEEIVYAGSSDLYFGDFTNYSTERIFIGYWKNRIGLMDGNGKIVFRPMIDSLGQWLPANICIYKSNGKYGIVNTRGKIMIDGCDSIQPFTQMPMDDYYFYADPVSWKNVLCFVNGKCGAFNDSAGLVVKIDFVNGGWIDDAHGFFWGEKNGKVIFAKINGKKTICTSPGNMLASLKSYDLDIFNFPMRVSGPQGMLLIDENGNILQRWNFSLGDRVDNASYFRISSATGVGIFDGDNDFLVAPPIFMRSGSGGSGEETSDAFYVETYSGNFGEYSASGKLIIDTGYVSLSDDDYPSFVHVGQRTDHNWDLIDSTGKIIAQSEEEILRVPETRRVIITIDQQEKIFDLDSNKIVCEGNYTRLIPLHDEFYIVYDEDAGKQGLMNNVGEMILPMEYNEIIGPFDGIFRVSNDLGDGVIDQDGNFIIPISDKSWALLPQNMDTIFDFHIFDTGDHENNIDFADDKFASLNDIDWKKCKDGMCEAANYHAAKNRLIDWLVQGDKTDDHFENNFYFAPVNLEEPEEYYDDEEIWVIDETASVKEVTAFSFTITDYVTADEGAGEDKFDCTNYRIYNGNLDTLKLQDIFDVGKNYAALNDSIHARAYMDNSDMDNSDKEIMFNCSNPDVLLPDYFIIGNKGITFIYVNQNEESQNDHLIDNLVYAGFTWNELAPYLNKNFASIVAKDRTER